jgi:hypothetical protein
MAASESIRLKPDATNLRKHSQFVSLDIIRLRPRSAHAWISGSTVRGSEEPSAHLLGLYDEYLIAYKDRSAALDRSRGLAQISTLSVRRSS